MLMSFALIVHKFQSHNQSFTLFAVKMFIILKEALFRCYLNTYSDGHYCSMKITNMDVAIDKYIRVCSYKVKEQCCMYGAMLEK
jgi:hypothetical protein